MIRYIILVLLWASSASAAVINAPFTAAMNAHDAFMWQKSDGFGNGAPFQVGWRADHVSFANGVMMLGLDNQPACSITSLNCSNQPYASGEYRSVDFVSYGTVRFRAKAVAASGVITGLFLYTGPSDGQPHDEIDIEFLGKNTNQVQFNYFTAGVGGHEVVLPLGFDASLAFHDYTIEWLPTVVNWYVDGVLKHSVSSVTGASLPSYPQHIFMNVWAATGVDAWSGAFTYTAPLQGQIDWVSYTPQGYVVANRAVGGCSLQAGGVFDPLWPLMLLLSLLYLLRRECPDKH